MYSEEECINLALISMPKFHSRYCLKVVYCTSYEENNCGVSKYYDKVAEVRNLPLFFATPVIFVNPMYSIPSRKCIYGDRTMHVLAKGLNFRPMHICLYEYEHAHGHQTVNQNLRLKGRM